MNARVLVLISVLSIPIPLLGQQAPSAAYPPIVHLNAEQDHQRLMDPLGIQTIRRGRDGNAASPFAANYDETKANPYPQLSDPLLLADGKRVTNAGMWWSQRRPQIIELFDRETYGRVPSSTPKVTWTVTSSEHATFGI